ncbi:MAG: V-type ATP synthase subunit E family protein [Pseudomonadota bacterium]
MNSQFKVEDLEQALMQRASDLAEEYLQRASISHKQIIEEANERLQLREEKEIMSAKMLAENSYRSAVQSSELIVQKKLDQLRWQLMENVLLEAKQKLVELMANQKSYMQLLIAYIQSGVKAINDKNLIIEFNQQDYPFIKSQWSEFYKQINSKKNIHLSEKFHQQSGGVIVYDQQYLVRIDNTFEGRIERLSEQIFQRVAEQFFSELSHESNKIHGR